MRVHSEEPIRISHEVVTSIIDRGLERSGIEYFICGFYVRKCLHSIDQRSHLTDEVIVLTVMTEKAFMVNPGLRNLFTANESDEYSPLIACARISAPYTARPSKEYAAIRPRTTPSTTGSNLGEYV